MKRLAVTSVLAVFFVLASLAGRAAQRVKTEVDGTWEMIRLSDKGKDDQETVKSKFVVARGNGIQTITKEGKLWKKMLYTVTSTAKPKQIAWSVPEQPDKIAAVGIYEIDGDTMKVAAFADETTRITERPKDFRPSEDKIVAEYKRLKEK